jgi:hypothetical protein
MVVEVSTRLQPGRGPFLVRGADCILDILAATRQTRG